MGHFMRVIRNLSVAFVVACAFFLFAGTYVSAAEETELFYYGRYALSQMEDGEDLVYAYDCLEAGFKANKDRIYISDNSHDITVSQSRTVYDFFTNDHPEYFWISGGYSYYLAEGDNVESLLPIYTLEGTALENAKKTFTEVGDSLIEGLEGKSEYEKSLILHNRLAYLVTYEFSENNQNAYGALVEEACVCAGYARSYQYLLNRVGISAWMVTGTATNSAGNTERHGWNLVRIDGKWYYTDVTWDDQGTVEEELYYAYFNVTEEEIGKNHFPNDVYDGILPEATSTEANYFYKDNRVFSTFNTKRVSELLEEGDGKTRVLVTGDVATFIDTYFENHSVIANEIGIWGAYTYGCSYMGNEVFLSFERPKQAELKHNFTKLTRKVAPSCNVAGTAAHYSCTRCGAKFNLDKEEVSAQSLVIPFTVSHNFIEVIDKEPTIDETGVKHEECTNCGEKRKEGTIIDKLPAPEPDPEPKPEQKPEIKPTPDKELPTIKAPNGTSLKTLKAGKKKITIKWKKQTKDVAGYEIQLATNKKFTKNVKLKAVTNPKKTSITINKLKSKKTYYVRICTYKVVNGKKIYSDWSKKILKVKVK